MFDYNRCEKCGAQWPEREGQECRVCAKAAERKTMKASEVYASIKANITGKNEAKQKAVAEAIRRIVASLCKQDSLGPHAFSTRDLDCDDLTEVAAALRLDGFDAQCFPVAPGASVREIRVSVPAPEMGGPR